MILDYKGVGVAGLVGIVIVWYLTRKAGNAAEAVIDGFTKFGDALNFSKDDLGPDVELTSDAQLSQDQYIAMGYLELLPDGRTRITASGQQYIESQQRVNR